MSNYSTGIAPAVRWKMDQTRLFLKGQLALIKFINLCSSASVAEKTLVLVKVDRRDRMSLLENL